MSSITRISCQTVPRHLKEPFRTSLRSVSSFDVIEFQIETDDGLRATGETVETPAITGDSQAMIIDGLLGSIKSALEGASFTSPLEIAQLVANTTAVASAKAAADMALYFLEAQMENKTFPELLDCTRAAVATDVTIPIVEGNEIGDLVFSRLKEGFSAFKVKLGREPIEVSIQKLKLMDRLIGCDGVIRIDPNQAWTVAHTLSFLDEVDKAGISVDYLEQPTPADDKSALAEIKRNTKIPIMADESCYDMEDLFELVEIEAVDLINLKLLKSGGITPIIKMADYAQQAGIGIRLGSMMEGDVGVFAAACVAGTLVPEETHDLDASWWARDSGINYEAGTVSLW